MPFQLMHSDRHRDRDGEGGPGKLFGRPGRPGRPGGAEAEAGVKVAAEEAAWLRMLQRLPLDVVYQILQCKGRWVRTARLVSKAWCRAAEQHVFGIRVNGEFAGISTARERGDLLGFVRRCQHLTSITLRNLDEITDEEAASIARHCAHLQRLALGGCRRLGDASLRGVDELEHLAQLNLAATAITDAGLRHVAGGCPRLENVNLYGCKHISAAGVRGLLEAHAGLESLNIRGTRIDKTRAEELQRDFAPKQVLTGPAHVDSIFG